MKDRVRSHYPFSVNLVIGGMTCDQCARRVENALNELEGVWAKVDISGCKAHVLSKQEPDLSLYRDAVRRAGYVVRSVSPSHDGKQV